MFAAYDKPLILLRPYGLASFYGGRILLPTITAAFRVRWNHVSFALIINLSLGNQYLVGMTTYVATVVGLYIIEIFYPAHALSDG